jgi:uncharacterized protein (UPF0335 family)
MEEEMNKPPTQDLTAGNVLKSMMGQINVLIEKVARLELENEELDLRIRNLEPEVSAKWEEGVTE